MIRNGVRRAVRRCIAAGVVLGAAGCLPIAWVEELSPPIVGVFRGADGVTPALGVGVALSHAFHDSTCTTPALQSVTDSAGGFRFPATQVQHRFVMLVPFDPVAPTYNLCAQVADS